MWYGLTIGQFFCKLHHAYINGYFDRSLSSRRSVLRRWRKRHGWSSCQCGVTGIWTQMMPAAC